MRRMCVLPTLSTSTASGVSKPGTSTVRERGLPKSVRSPMEDMRLLNPLLNPSNSPELEARGLTTPAKSPSERWLTMWGKLPSLDTNSPEERWPVICRKSPSLEMVVTCHTV